MATASTWPAMEELIERADHAALTRFVCELDDAQRRALARDLRAYDRNRLSRMRSGEGGWGDDASLAIAGVGVLPDATSTATWLRRHALRSWLPSDNPWGRPRELDAQARVALVLLERDPPWLPALVDALAARLPTEEGRDGGLFGLIETLRKQRRLAPPATDGYVAHWIYTRSTYEGFIADFLEDRRFLDLIPRIFDVDAIGLFFSWRPDQTGAIVQLVERRVVDRAVVLDACVARLQRPGRPHATAAYLALHEELNPSDDEVATRLRDYVALLPDTLSTVATMAQQRLTRLEQRGRLPVDDLVDATRSVLVRPEKKLVRAQLAWLGDAARRDPTLAGRLAEAAAAAFAHPAVDQQRAAVKFVTSLATKLTADRRATVRAEADLLPLDLRAQLVAALGEEADRIVATAPSARLTPPTRRPLSPVQSPEEVAEELLVMITSTPDRLDTPTLERVLDGVLRYSADPQRLRAGLAPALTHDFYAWLRQPPRDYFHPLTVNAAVSELIAAVLDDPPQPGHQAHCGHEIPPVQHAIVHRILRLAAAARAGQLRSLVSFPTWTNGVLAWPDLVERLERAGSAYDPFDVDQAVLRLEMPDAERPELTRALRRLDTPAARHVIDRLEPGHPDAPPTMRALRDRTVYTWDERGSQRPATVSSTVAVLASEGARREAAWVWTLLTDFPKGSDDVVWGGWSSAVRCWPAVLPRHRDVIAAYLVRPMAALGEMNDRAEVLPLLAEADGPVGHGMTLALGYALAAKTGAARNDAVDALVVLAARQQLDGHALGRDLGHLVVRREVTPTRLVAPLRDAAHAGAALQVQGTLDSLLEAVLTTGDSTPPGFADLLALAVEAAELTGAAPSVAGLAEFAGRRGSSRQLVEARRLMAVGPSRG